LRLSENHLEISSMNNHHCTESFVTEEYPLT
jgi:hypothetical protein